MTKNSPPSELPELASKEELARFLRSTTRYVEYQVSAGKLRMVKLSTKMVRFRRSDVEAWLEASAQ